MKRNTFPLCALLLAASFSSCAPGFLFRPDVKVGHDMAYVQRVYLNEIRPQTPDSAYVILPDCPGGAVSVRDVRRLGPQRAAEACREQVAKPPVDWRGMRVMVGVVVTSFLVYYFVFKGNSFPALQPVK